MTEQQADGEVAAALEELESLQSEYLALQQDIDRALDQLHSPPDKFEEEKSSARVDAKSKGQTSSSKSCASSSVK